MFASAHHAGFSLLEILAALIIIAILTIVAFPNYRAQIGKAHRSDGQIALLNLANHLENYFWQNNHSYAQASLEKLNMPPQSSQGFYQIKIINVTPDSYLIAAIPLNAQTKNDSPCGELFLDQTGNKSQSGTTNTNNCWE